MDDLKQEAPLVAAVRAARAAGRSPLQIPGHKLRYMGVDESVLGFDVLHDLVRDDIPLQGGADDNSFSHGFLNSAEKLYASAIGARQTRFLVGGSTQGNIAAFLTVAETDTTIAVDRTSHRSALAGLVLSGAMPQWIYQRIHPEFGIPVGMDVAALQETSGCSAVFITCPSYVGTLSDVRALSQECHRLNMPLLVDQAWGAHLDFDVPGYHSALAQGADLVVTSTHKALMGYSQTATISCSGERIDVSRLGRAVDITATTSPSATLLASIDAARLVMQREGAAAIDRAIETSQEARSLLRQVKGLVVLDDSAAGCQVDPLKIVLWLPRTGCTGVEIAASLWADGHGVESADNDTLVMTVSVADDRAVVLSVVEKLMGMIDSLRRQARAPMPSAVWATRPKVMMTPRAAMFAKRERVPLRSAIGRVSTEQFCPYPPGVPLVGPGEEVTLEIVEAIEVAGRLGRVAYCSDATLQTIEVVCD